MTENKAASIQALKFGARMYFPSKVTTVDTSGERLRISLFGGIEILARAVIIATGAHPVPSDCKMGRVRERRNILRVHGAGSPFLRG
ncbi:hypothetical protein ACH4S9_32775 [Streptomyces sp. NPDC021225]|uniref:hypothetical protein n=1 Tax=Streptomyces sp. NPDC021225 TaxID=3365121 RepID=UPI00378FBC2A